MSDVLKISYARKPKPDQLQIIRGTSGNVLIKIAPGPTWAFAGKLILISLGIVICGGIAAGVFRANPSELRVVGLLGANCIGLLFYLVQLVRSRRLPQRLAVAQGVLCMSTVIDGGGLRGIPPQRCRKLVVCRCKWNPTVHQLEARANRGFFELHGAKENEPIVLLSGLSRKTLEQIAEELGKALGLEAQQKAA